MEIAVSYLKSKLSKSETINKIDESKADLIHVDLMDGIYAGVCNFTMKTVIDDLKYTNKPLDIHLMTINPEVYINDLAKLNIDTITFHFDATDNIEKTINLIKKYNFKVGVALSIEDDVDIIKEYISKIDYVLVMTVYPGKGGQEFMPRMVSKLKKLQKEKILLGVDGGIKKDSIKYLKDIRVDRLISGSFICLSDDYNKQIDILKKQIN